MTDRKPDATAAFEDAIRQRGTAQYVLRLYVTRLTPRCTRAIDNIRAICERHLEGRYELEVIDIRQRPELARDEQIVAVPTLIKRLPLPLRRIVGDLSDTERVLVHLDVLSSKAPPRP
ncbi:MAG: circadian clock KaiB family protein [Bacillota bacterium]